MTATYGIRTEHFEETPWNEGGYKFHVTKNGHLFHVGRTMYQTEAKAVESAKRYIRGREKRVKT